MTLLQFLTLTLISISTMMVLAWIISLFLAKVSIVDSFWGLGFVLAAWQGQIIAPGYPLRKTLLTVLVTLWGVRLAIHLTLRNWGKPEDPRYAKMRDRWGPSFRWVSLFTIFLLQAALLWFVSLAVQLGQWANTPDALVFSGWVGIMIWCCGFFFETVGDYQLYRFKKNPSNKGKVLDRGLWRYTRHPNYFGESLMWWGIYLMVVATPYRWWGLISPVLITVLLLKVSGVSLMEKDISDRRPEYADYKRRTNAFLPWFPKEKES